MVTSSIPQRAKDVGRKRPRNPLEIRQQGPNWFRRRREELGLTQFEMAIRLGMTASPVCAWEKAKDPPRLTNFGRIAKAYEVPLETVAIEAARIFNPENQPESAEA
jgi:transcriptional regulator with XRE-family HTH domain